MPAQAARACNGFTITQGLGPGVAAGHGAVALAGSLSPGRRWCCGPTQASSPLKPRVRLGLREHRSMERAATAAPEPKDTAV
ncbi:unnamed protein product [Arctogadus glacialis]